MNVIVVDDKEENRYLLETLFTAGGHAVQTAANGAEALEKLRAGDFNLIVSDILMPVMDGFELCRKVKTDESLRRIPFIIYTATYTGPQDEAFAVRIGADRFIVKPCEPEIFMQAVGEVLAAAERKAASPPPAPLPEDEALKLYNERLVRKLEQKMLQLEKEVLARRRAEEILRQSESRYRALFNSIRDAIHVVDKAGKTIDCNPAFSELFGYTQEEAAGKDSLHFFESEEEYRRISVEYGEQGSDTDLIYSANLKKKNGTVFPGEVKIFKLHDDASALTGFIGLIRDTSERKRAETKQKELESQLYQSQKMESVGRLAGGVAHDFNNLLTIILGYGEVVMQALGKNHLQYEPLSQVYQAGLRAKDLTRQLLAFSRKQVLEMSLLDVSQVASGFEKLLRRLLGEDIRFKLSLAAAPLPVKADAAQLEQVLMNLAVNASDAMPEGGTLTIETAAVELDPAYAEKKPGVLPGRYAMIAVSDNGCGMDKATLDRLFEPFFTTKGLDKGTGLGLATSYGIVKQHGGNIWVYSEPGEGTTFKVYLPLHAEAPAVKVEAVKAQAGPSASTTVLLVEDDLPVRELAFQILTDQGYRVLAANGAAEGVATAARHAGPIHLVLTDVVMPGLKGPEVFDKVKQFHPEARVLYMSGYTDNLIAQQGVLKENIAFLQKPFTVKGLLEKCRLVLKGE